jgi:hypothetical protein
MPRYRLLSSHGDDLGPFLSGDTRWEPGDTLALGSSGLFRITAVVEPEKVTGDVTAYLVLDELPEVG